MSGKGVERCGALAFAVAEPPSTHFKKHPLSNSPPIQGNLLACLLFYKHSVQASFLFPHVIFINSNPQTVGDVTSSRISVKGGKKGKLCKYLAKFLLVLNVEEQKHNWNMLKTLP